MAVSVSPSALRGDIVESETYLSCTSSTRPMRSRSTSIAWARPLPGTLPYRHGLLHGMETARWPQQDGVRKDMNMDSHSVVGLVSPGEMGSAIGRELVSAGRTVLRASRGCSGKSFARAHRAGLTDVGEVDDLLRSCSVVLSVVPPHAALETARSVQGFRGLYIDANAISPETAARVMAAIEDEGGVAVDGGIVGLPPGQPGGTRLYLSGREARTAREVFAGTGIDVISLDGDASSASALKMTYAALTKGGIAMLLAAHDTARALGVLDALEDEWRRSRPESLAQLAPARAVASEKGWRWISEMEKIARTFRSAGSPDGFHRAAAEVFQAVTDGGRVT